MSKPILSATFTAFLLTIAMGKFVQDPIKPIELEWKPSQMFIKLSEDTRPS